jgi:hypothetical protein
MATEVATDSCTERIGLPQAGMRTSIASPQETVFKVFEEHPEHIDSMTAVATRIALDRYQVGVLTRAATLSLSRALRRELCVCIHQRPRAVSTSVQVEGGCRQRNRQRTVDGVQYLAAVCS